MLCAAIDIGSNTTRLLVAEPEKGQLRKVMEQRAYTRDRQGPPRRRARSATRRSPRSPRWCRRQVRLAEELGAEVIKIVATAAIREAKNREKVARRSRRRPGVEVEVLSDEEEGRLAFLGATKSLGHPVEGKIAVVDVGGGSSEVIFGTVAEGVEEVRSFKIGSGSLTEDHLEERPALGVRDPRAARRTSPTSSTASSSTSPTRPSRSGGSATSLRTLVGAVLEYETLERAVRVLSSDAIADVAQRFELDARRVKLLPAGVLLLEKFSRAARPAAADRQGRAARGDHPRPAQRGRATVLARRRSPPSR